MRRAALAVPATVVAVLLAGCTPTPTASPTASTTSVTPTITASPPPSFSPNQQQAITAVKRFYEVLDQVGSDTEVSLNALHEVAAGELVEDRLKIYGEDRVVGVRQVGRTQIAEVRSVVGEVGTFSVVVCVDRSAVDFLDKNGESIVAKGTPRRYVHTYEVQEIAGVLKPVKDEATATC